MKKMRKVLAVLMILTLLVTVFAGCKKQDDNGKETGTTESTAAETSPILQKDVIVVGTNAEFPPFEYLLDDGVTPDGFDMALIKAIGEKMGKEVKIENMDFDAILAAIGNKVDIAIAGLTVDEERLLQVDFSDTYFTAVQSIIVKENDDTIKSAEDLKGKKIGVQLGTTGDIIATDDIEGATVERYKKAITAVLDLLNGRIDAVLIDSATAKALSAANKGTKVIEGDFEPEHYAIALPKGDTALKNSINKALKEVKEDGTFDELLEKYIESGE
ncbi:MAG TPA: basic amino acid ABC transporter substrate-binding protein [Clostridiales bacterium]|nr:basic amino acid ABC transporter substrate-binding protein [Clostridiales bacterium]